MFFFVALNLLSDPDEKQRTKTTWLNVDLESGLLNVIWHLDSVIHTRMDVHIGEGVTHLCRTATGTAVDDT